MHLVTIRFVLRYTACDAFYDTICAIHFLIFYLYRNYQMMKTYETGSMVKLVTVYSMISFFRNKKIPNIHNLRRNSCRFET